MVNFNKGNNLVRQETFSLAPYRQAFLLEVRVMDDKRDLILKLTKEEVGDLITTIGTAILFLTRYGLLSQRHRVMRVRDLVWSQVSGQLIVKPRKQNKMQDGEEGSLSITYFTKKE